MLRGCFCERCKFNLDQEVKHFFVGYVCQSLLGGIGMTFRPLRDRVVLGRSEEEASATEDVFIPDTARETSAGVISKPDKDEARRRRQIENPNQETPRRRNRRAQRKDQQNKKPGRWWPSLSPEDNDKSK